MPSFACRRVDPPPEEVARIFGWAYQQAAATARAAAGVPQSAWVLPPSAEELLQRAAGSPVGVFAREYPVQGAPRGATLGACWWTDGLGHRHWYIEGAVAGENSFFRRVLRPGEAGGGLMPDLFGQDVSGAELSCGWRTRAGRGELVVLCRCGACGPPAELAWTGSSCGPCADREQDGLPPAGPPPLRDKIRPVSAFLLADDGALLTVHRLYPAVAPDAGAFPWASFVRGWAAPWTGEPTWERRWADDAFAGACDGRFAAVGAPGQPLALVRVADGQTWAEGEEGRLGAVWEAVFAGEERDLLVAVEERAGVGGLSVYERTKDGGIGRRLHWHGGAYRPGAIAAASTGDLVAAARDEDVEVRDARSGELIERLVCPDGLLALRCAFLPDGAIVATYAQSGYAPDQRQHLSRWGPAAGTPRRGWRSWLPGAGRRAPERLVTLSDDVLCLAVSPDGRLLAGVTGSALYFWAAESLEELVRLEVGATFNGSLAFTADGQLLAATSKGLAAWPWRELAGLL